MNKNDDNILYMHTWDMEMEVESSPHYYHYEATPYAILYHLFDEYQLQRTDGFVDFGSGKGRLLFYVHHQFGCSITGIEMSEYLHQKAIKNKQKYLKHAKRKDSIQLLCSLAEKYSIKETDNVFYFFNPFSVQIFIKIVNNILDSVDIFPRTIDLILYYPSKMYIHYLEQHTLFQLQQEIKIPVLYPIDENERFLIYRLEA